ncbi:hypothetical protein TUSST3_68780 [Streptomyces sp. TUS-ST3]|nr:hypothetical protein TUSST3_68780 [Streptomyces sp. TUS-ST3]
MGAVRADEVDPVGVVRGQEGATATGEGEVVDGGDPHAPHLDRSGGAPSGDGDTEDGAVVDSHAGLRERE